MNLEKVVKDEIEKITKFKKWYILMNKKNPEHYPLNIPEENSGVWFDMIDDFDPNNPDVLKLLES